jgi:hypothetical protein
MHKPLLEPLEGRTLLSLVAPVVYNLTSQGPEGLAVGDLRGNGRLDIVTANNTSGSVNNSGSVSVLLGNGDGTFQPAVDFATGGTGTQFVALGHLGRGGSPLDVVTANRGSETVSVLLGNGDGTFGPAVQYGVGARERPIAVAVGDFTGDGIPDLVTVNVPQAHDQGINSFSLLVGNPDGTFQTAVTQPLGINNTPSSLAAGDFTGNGILSIAVGTSGRVMVLLGNGNGTFQAPVSYAADNSRVSSIVVSDLAGTGKLDLATANPATDTVSVLLGNGNGTFGPATNYPVGGQGPQTVAVGRFRPGGPLDLVTDDVDSNSVSVLPGSGTGTFGTAAQYFAADFPSAVATGNFTGSGINDIAVTNNPQGSLGTGAVSVLLNRGNGTFAPLPVQLSQGVEGVATGDLRGIGVQDLVVTNEFAGTVSVFLGNGDGTFGAPQTFPAGIDPLAVVVGDFTGDGRPDLVVSEGGGSTSVDLLQGNGDGTFRAPHQIPVGATAPSIAAGHFHSPNILDLAATDFQNNRVNVILNNGGGNFRAPVSYAVGQDPQSVAVGDFQGNGITDLVVANAGDNTVSVLLGKGNGKFQPAVNYSISSDPTVANFPRFVTVGSLRSNGPLDIVTTNFGSSNVTVLLGNGDGTFGAPIHLNAGVGNDAAAIADFDNDGTPDILVTNSATDTVTLLPGNGDGTFRAPVQFGTGTGPFAMSVGHFDGHNLPEVAVLGTTTISVLLNDSSSFAPSGSASANGTGQIVGTGLTSNGTRQAFAAGEPAPEETAAPLLMQDQPNALPWLSKAREIRWAVRTRSISRFRY